MLPPPPLTKVFWMFVCPSTPPSFHCILGRGLPFNKFLRFWEPEILQTNEFVGKVVQDNFSGKFPTKKIGCLGTVQHFLPLDLQKCCTVPKKPKKPIFLSLQGTPTKKIGCLGTVQHFLPLDLQKCCTVPKKPIFLESLPWRLEMIGFLGILGTVQHFSSKGLVF